MEGKEDSEEEVEGKDEEKVAEIEKIEI